MFQAYLYLCLGWGVFYALHSFLATIIVKDWIKSHLPALHSVYRLSYNIFAILTLALLLAYHIYLPSQTLFVGNLFTKVLAGVLVLGGSGIVLVAFKNYNTSEFLGLKTENTQNPQLAITGLNRLVRHPLYLGVVLLFLGLWIWESSLKNLIALLALWVYLLIGIYLEEQKLLIYFGEAYKNYQKQVKKLIPWVW